jgi:hypothetical protein
MYLITAFMGITLNRQRLVISPYKKSLAPIHPLVKTSGVLGDFL